MSSKRATKRQRQESVAKLNATKKETRTNRSPSPVQVVEVVATVAPAAPRPTKGVRRLEALVHTLRVQLSAQKKHEANLADEITKLKTKNEELQADLTTARARYSLYKHRMHQPDDE